MGVVGHGVDLVEVEHFRRLCVAPDKDELLARFFTVGELARVGVGADQPERLAGRFAAKEAVLKALGVGWSQGIAWTDVEIGALDSGAPTVVLHARCAAIAAGQGVTSWLISISHTGTFAMASVVSIGDEKPPHGRRD